MVLYNFKSIQVVPSATDFVDIILSKTQRKTPTIIHRHFAISRIRQFYMRKVKYTQQNFSDKLNQILTDFPILDEIHPFYDSLINVLYDRDHYKLALGQLNMCKHLLENIGRDYVRLLKYGDSLYRCKQLKRAAMGRMCTIVKKQQTSLAYLEEVRQHLARLPSIDPSTRSIILCGYPNVGKSSFVNRVTRADVEVQPYAFTTKSLFIGHTDHKYVRWQVMDTPGILDHPLEERNTIEMLSITALAHLRASILFLVDISEQCGYSIKNQVSLFHSIKPLFAGKPVIVALNKVDACRVEDLDAANRALIEQIEQSGVPVLTMSTLTDVNVSGVKEFCCDRLLEMRVDEKLRTTSKRAELMGALHVAVPVPRDSRSRPPVIPESIATRQAAAAAAVAGADAMETEERPRKDNPWHNRWLRADEDPDWDPTILGPDWREQYDLANPEWKLDAIPEIVDGMNVADYIDPDILERLLLLEREEEMLLARDAEQAERDRLSGVQVTEEDLDAIDEMEYRRDRATMEARLRHKRNTPAMPRSVKAAHSTLAEFKDHMRQLGVDPADAARRLGAESSAASHARSRAIGVVSRAALSHRAAHDVAKDRRETAVLPATLKEKAVREKHRSQRPLNRDARKGEGDRHIYDERPKHLLSGKRPLGKTSRR